MKDCLIAITTFCKTDALSVLLGSLAENGYLKTCDIVICDDNGNLPYQVTKEGNPQHPYWVDHPEETKPLEMPSAGKVVEIFNSVHDSNVKVLHGKGRKGIAINKNRGIKYFLEHEAYKDMIMLDDDIVVSSSEILDRCRASGHPHLCGYLGEPNEPEGEELHTGRSGNSFWSVPEFRAQGEDEHVYYSGGAQGMFLYVKRELLDQVQYLNVMKNPYGFEHAIWSNRLNLANGKNPDWFPILKGCGRLFQSQAIPNNYHIKDVYANSKEWQKLKELCYKGVGIKVSYPGDLT